MDAGKSTKAVAVKRTLCDLPDAVAAAIYRGFKRGSNRRSGGDVLPPRGEQGEFNGRIAFGSVVGMLRYVGSAMPV